MMKKIYLRGLDCPLQNATEIVFPFKTMVWTYKILTIVCSFWFGIRQRVEAVMAGTLELLFSLFVLQSCYLIREVMANVLHIIIHYFKQLLFEGSMLINIF